MKNIKKLLILSLLINFSSNYTFASDTTKAFLLPFVQMVPKTGQTAISAGLNASYSPINKFFIGVSYQSVLNSFMPLTEKDTRKELTSSWGGLIFDYNILNREVYRVYTNVGVGMGLLDIIIDEPGALPDENEIYQYLQVGASFDVPISKQFFFSLGWQYRFISEIDYKNVSASDIGGVSGKFGIRYLFLK